MGLGVQVIQNFIKKHKKQGPSRYRDTNLSFEERVDDIVSRMTLSEKRSQMINKSIGVRRLGIPPYNWWNECLHGVGRAELATVFPQAIGLGATFNPELIYDMACVISDEARAKHHKKEREKKPGKWYYGLTFWSPNINIFRDPRWGRGQETYGEDPYLMAQLGMEFCKGLQGEDPKYLKLVATPKHYVVHSGPEGNRHSFNAIATPKDLRETYLYAFKETVVKAKAYSVMGAYNRTNGELCSGSYVFLQQILRDEFGFEGFIVSDCSAIRDFHKHHKVTENVFESAALGVKTGCDLNCGAVYLRLNKAVAKKYITEEEVDVSLKRLFLARMKLGMFDPPEIVPYAQIPYDVVDCEKHRILALKTAQECIVLLKNENDLLPLPKSKKKINTIAVIGPNADDKEALYGNYNGTPSYAITPLEGIRRECAVRNIDVKYTKGCVLFEKRDKDGKLVESSDIVEAISIAKTSDAIVLVMGISNEMEGEQKKGRDDRNDIALPPIQQQLIKQIYEDPTIQKNKTPIILVLINGSPVSVPWAQENLDSIIETWYGGQEAGTALADVIFGKYAPAGKMPITVPYKTEDLPDLEDYNMDGRTYRYIHDDPLYPFGYGLSYRQYDIEYTGIKLSNDSYDIANYEKNANIEVSITIKNNSEDILNEVVQLYLKDLDSNILKSERIPHHSLKGIKRIELPSKETVSVTFELLPCDLAIINEEGKSILEPGEVQLFVGGSQPDDRSIKLTGKSPLSIKLLLSGKEPLEIPYIL